MAALYIVAAVPAAMAAGSALPLSDAKVCTSGDFEERGALIGYSSDRLYLGEPRRRDRRITVLPAGTIEQVFIGRGARDAVCDFGDARAALVARERADTAAAAAAEASAALASMVRADSAQALLEAAQTATGHAGRAGLAALETSDQALVVTRSDAVEARRHGNETLRVVAEQRTRLAALDIDGDSPPPAELSAGLRRDMTAIVSAAERAADAANATAKAVHADAVRRQPSSD